MGGDPKNWGRPLKITDKHRGECGVGWSDIAVALFGGEPWVIPSLSVTYPWSKVDHVETFPWLMWHFSSSTLSWGVQLGLLYNDFMGVTMTVTPISWDMVPITLWIYIHLVHRNR